MELGDRYLVVQRASIGAKGISSTPGMPSAEEYSAAMGSGTSIPRPILPAQVDAADQSTARILLMLNMVTPEDLVDDSEYQDILEDIKAECGNYGPVENILVPRPPKRERSGWVPGSVNSEKARADQQHEGVGRVYVKYADPAGAANALKALAGRSFAGRSIIATLLGEEANSLFEQVVPSESAGA